MTKTLDEVIKALEYCLNPVDNFGNCNAECPYIHCCDPSNHDVTEDALYYLKEYKKDKQIYSYDIARRNLEIAERNDLLSWDELLTMEGKPVWVEVYDPIDEKTGWHTASWKLIEFINDEYFDVRDSDGEQECFYKSENDCYCWQAYRKERE